MESFEVTKLGERGQIVIPQEFRKSMKLEPGEKFIIIGRGETLMFKRLQAPSIEEFDIMIRKSHARAKKLKLTSKELEEVRKRSRSKK